MNNSVSELIKANDVQHPLKSAQEHGLPYYDQFIQILSVLREVIPKKKYDDLLKNKFHLGKGITLVQYLQAACELSVTGFLANKYKDTFKYEPVYNGKKNPECSFMCDDVEICVEVKTPDLSKRIEDDLANNKQQVTVYFAERIENHDKVVSTIKHLGEEAGIPIKEKRRLDNKLSDYVNSANEKFPLSTDKNFNILVVCLDIISDLDEWYSYLFGDTGIFSSAPLVAPGNVDAIMLTNLMCGHYRFEAENPNNLWDLQNYGNFLFLNPLLENSKKGEFYWQRGIDIFGPYTRNFFGYLQFLDSKILNNGSLTREQWLMHKFRDSNIFTEYWQFISQQSKA